MDFRLLGPLEVVDDNRPLELGGAKQRSVLAILLMNANELVTTDQLIDEIWGGTPPAKAAKNIQVQVSRLRKVLDPDASRRVPAATCSTSDRTSPTWRASSDSRPRPAAPLRRARRTS